MKNETTIHAVENANGWLASIREMVSRLEDENTREEIQQSVLDIQVRSGWVSPNEVFNQEAAEYSILLSTGGPALRITGELDNGEVSTARLEHQD